MDYPTKVSDLGATAHYRLGEPSGTTIVDAIGSADGTYVNTPDLAVAGAIRDGDTAVTFKTASSEYGTLTTLGSFGSSLATCSVAFWIKSISTSGQSILGAGNSSTTTALRIQSNLDAAGSALTGATRLVLRNDANASTLCHLTTNIYDGNWHFVVVVMNGGWVAYVDGVAVSTSSASGSGTGTYSNFTAALDIAAYNNAGSHVQPLNAWLDEVAFFPTQLTLSDVRNLWFEGAIKTDYGSTQTTGAYYDAMQTLSPDLYWRLDEPSGNYYAADASGGGHKGFYIPPNITFSATGLIDENKGITLGPTTGGGTTGAVGFIRALDYEPYAVNAQLTVCGISRIRAYFAGFQTVFSGDAEQTASGLPHDHPTLELSSVFRWYSDVDGDFPAHQTDWNAPAPPAAGSWFHWALVIDDTLAPSADATKLYINGALQTASFPVTGWAQGFIAAHGGRFQVGARGYVPTLGEIWAGEHDEIAVFERVLSSGEIAGLYAAMSGWGADILLESGDEMLLEDATFILTEVVAPAPLTFGSSTGASSATLALKTKTLVPLAASTGVTSATLALKAKTGIALGAATGVSSATLALKAKTLVALAASTGASSATLALKAKTLVPLVASSGVSSATLDVTAAAPPAQIVPCAASQGQSGATLALRAPAKFTLGSSTGTSSASLALRAPAKLTLALSAGLSSATLALRAPAKLTLGAASAVSSATLALKAKALISLAASSGQSTATLTLKARALLDLDDSSATSSATLNLLARAYLVLGSSDGQSGTSLSLHVLTVIPLGASSGQSSATIDILRPPIIPLQASTGLSAATLALWVQTRIPLGAVAAHSSATLTVIGPQRAYLTLGESNAISSAQSLRIHYAVLLAPSSGVSTTGLLGIYTPTLVALNASLGVSGGELTVFFPFTLIALTPAFAHSAAHLLMGMSILVFEQQSEQGSLSFGEHGIMAEDRVGRVIQNTV